MQRVKRIPVIIEPPSCPPSNRENRKSGRLGDLVIEKNDRRADEEGEKSDVKGVMERAPGLADHVALPGGVAHQGPEASAWLIEAVHRLAEADDPVPSHPFVNEGGGQREKHPIKKDSERDGCVPQDFVGDLMVHLGLRMRGSAPTRIGGGTAAKTINHPRCAKFNPRAKAYRT